MSSSVKKTIITIKDSSTSTITSTTKATTTTDLNADKTNYHNQRRQYRQLSGTIKQNLIIDDSELVQVKENPNIDDNNINNDNKDLSISCNIDNQTNKLEYDKNSDVVQTSGSELEHNQELPIVNSYFNRSMILYCGRELVCILIIIFSTYATFQNVSPKLFIAPEPQPFFSKGSLVHDWPTGDLKISQAKVSQSELAFVMFYAPWCAESQHARLTYEYVTRLYYREAYFAAINCWQPGGECRHQYGKVMSWPVLMAYLQNGLAISYTGKWNNYSLTQFINAIITPIKRITTINDLLKLIVSHDAVIVAFLDMEQHKEYYLTFYQTAVKSLEKDPYHDLAFSVVTGSVASIKEFGVQKIPTIRMYLWNETLEMENDTITVINLQKWINEYEHHITDWLTPPGTKSNLLAPYFNGGPALILFTPRIIYDDSVDAYTMLRQVSLEFYNICEGNDWIQQLTRNVMVEYRNENHKEYVNAKKECDRKDFEHFNNENQHTNNNDIDYCSCDRTRSVSMSFVNLLNYSKYVDACKKRDKSSASASCSMMLEESEDSCFATSNIKYDNKLQSSSKWIGDSNFKTSLLNNEFDNRSPENLLKRLKQKKCDSFTTVNTNPIFFPNFLTDFNKDDNSSKSICKYNKSLSMIAIDSIIYHTFAERLGIDVLNLEKRSTAIILDHENESTYVLNDTLSTTSLINFLNDFLNRKLTRFLRNSSKINYGVFYNKSMNGKNEIKHNKLGRKIQLLEMNSSNFAKYVLHSNETVVVLFYSTQCALCNMITQSLLMTSRILSDLSNIRYARIDGDKNDLPWQYTMETFPTLIIFPSDRKSESRKLPSNLNIDVKTVLGFVLANLDRPNRLHGLILACKNTKIILIVKDCLDSVRREIIDNISFSLGEWRKIPYNRNKILRRLQLLQKLFLQLFNIKHSCDFNELEISMKNIKKIWSSKN